MKNIAGMFTPKTIIMQAIKSKLENTGVTKLILSFSCINDSYRIMVLNTEGNDMNIDVSKEELNTVKKLFINKVVKAWQKKYKPEPSLIIIQVDVQNESLELFIEATDKQTYKFDY